MNSTTPPVTVQQGVGRDKLHNHRDFRLFLPPQQKDQDIWILPKIGLTEQAILAIWLYVFERNKKDFKCPDALFSIISQYCPINL